MEDRLRPSEPFIFGTHPCASVGIVREISTVLQSSAAFGCGIESTDIVNVSMTSTTDVPEDHRQEFVNFRSSHHSAQDFDSKANNDGSLEYSSQSRDSEINGPVAEAGGGAVEPEQADSSCIKRPSKTGSERIAYGPNKKENNGVMNEHGTSRVRGGGEPVSPVSSTTVPLLTRLDRLDIVLAYLEEKSLYSGHSIPAPNTNEASPKPTFENSSSTKSLEKRCKPINSVLVETEAKGNIVERVASLENKVSKLSEGLERMITCVRSSSLGGEATNVNMKGLNTASGFDIFEEEKHQVLPEEECVRKGVHENISITRPQRQLDIPKVSSLQTEFSPRGEKKDENVLADRKNNSENVLKGTMDGNSETKGKKKTASKDTKTATGENKKRFSKDENKSPTPSGTGKLRHLLTNCIFPHSHKRSVE